MNIVNVLYNLKHHKILIWKKDDNNISFSFDLNHGFPEFLKLYIQQNKNELLKILDFNNIESEEKSKNTIFYKIPELFQIKNLSHIQKSIFLQSKLDLIKYTYNVPLFIRLDKINIEILGKALKYVLAKHPILRIGLSEGFQYTVLDIEQFSVTESHVNEEDVNKLCEQKSRHQFNLETEKLINLEIIKIRGGDRCILNLTHHHILADAYSLGLIISEILSAYTALSGNDGVIPITSLVRNINYFDYISYQNYELQTEGYKEAIAELSNKLDNSESLQLKKNSLALFDNKGDSFNIKIDVNIYTRLQQVSLDNQVSLYSILLTSLYHVLSVYAGGQVNFPIGLTVSNRPFELNDVIGPFISTLPLIPNYSPDETFINNIKNVHREIVYLNEYHQINLGMLVEYLTPGKSIADLMHVMFTMHNFKHENTNLHQENYDLIKVKDTAEQFGISITASERDNEILFNISYAKNLYQLDYIKAIFDCFIALLSKIDSTILEKQSSDLNLLSEEEYKKIIYDWNKVEQSYPNNKTIHELFEEQVEKSPDRIAVVHQDKKITYRELNNKANQLANFLRKSGAKTEGLIGIGIDRSIEMIVAILGVLKAGGAYVPMDLSYPAERLEYMLSISEADILLIQSSAKDKFKNYDGKIIEVDDCKDINKENQFNPGYSVTSDNLAVIIFTSGSTGRPKGVMMEHRTKLNHIFMLISQLSLSEEDRLAQTASQSFDISVWQMLAPILVGGSTNIFDTNLVQDSNRFLKEVINQSITILQVIPTYLDALIEVAKNIELLQSSLRWIIITGENSTFSICKRCFSVFGLPMINLYGPAECSDDVTIFLVKDLNDVREIVPIGKPLPNMKFYILDVNLHPVPVGVTGEIYIGGLGVTRGYLNRPDLTAEKFIANPFITEEEVGEGKNLRLYRTGDIARYLPDGNVEFLGRIDDQVKIRGYRIELGEIESALKDNPNVYDCIVLVKDDDTGDKKLVAYIVPKDNNLYKSEIALRSSAGKEFNILEGAGISNTTEELRKELLNKLPEYMVPSYFVYIDKIPLTPNDKIDRKSLPLPKSSIRLLVDSYVAPRNELEHKVCQIWANVLGLSEDKIGIHDNFFMLGGNSILAIKLISKLNSKFYGNISFAAIFKHNTIDKLAYYFLNNTEDITAVDKSRVVKSEDQLLSFAQQRLWFIEKYEGGTNAYNMPMVFKLSQDSDLEILKDSIRSVVSRHEVLRTLIKEDDEGNGYQVVINDHEHPLVIKDCGISSILELDQYLEKEVNQVFDLSNEYPIRVKFYNLVSNKKEDSTNYLSIVIHHIAFDGWSTEIFMRELQIFYYYHLNQSKGKEAKLELPTLSIQYKDFALWQRSYLTGERLDKQINYWKDKLSGYETLNLITDKPRPSQVNYEGKDIDFELDVDTSIRLRELAKELKVSLYSLLLAGYCLMLRSYSNQDDIVIGTTIANRNYSQVENLIGFFVNTLALRAKIDSNLLLKDFIQKIGQETVESQFHQDLPFEKLVEELKIPKDTSKHPIFQVMFGVQHFENEAFFNKMVGNSFPNILYDYTTNASVYNVAKFDISTFLDDSQVYLKGRFNYAVSLYTEETIKGFIETYTEVLKQIAILASDKQKQYLTKVADIAYLNEEQYNKIIVNWNDTDKSYPEHITVHALFEKQVEETPNNIAIIYEDTKLTYNQLNEKANQLANYLIRNYDIKPDTLIALCLDRSEHILIAILAVLKAGGAYVPIDYSSPDERIDYILQDIQTELLLTSEAFYGRLEHLFKGISVIIVDKNGGKNKLQTYQIDNPNRLQSSSNLAYVMYTSGTTGKPKGVMVEHKSIINYAIAIINDLNFRQNDIHLMISEYIFDLGYTSVWGAILLGGTLHMIKKEVIHSAVLITKYIKDNRISIIKTTPLYLKLLLSAGDTGFLDSIKTIIVGGEKLTIDVLTLLVESHNNTGGIKLFNHYGPTETTIGCVIQEVNYMNQSGRDLFIKDSVMGTPIANMKCYILNADLKPVPLGGIGELHIGGEGLARGYLNNQDITATKFIKNHFCIKEIEKGKNKIIYKTGDLARWTLDGRIVFLKRNDHQVKVNGFRIELEEIEAALRQHGDVADAVVIIRENAAFDRQLIAFIVHNVFTPSMSELNDFLRLKLPNYMIPNLFVYLDQLPLTINGKLDRAALANFQFTKRDNFIPPRDELEVKVCKIWAEMLGLQLENVGVRDDFFSLGGNSISAIRLVSKLNRELNYSVSLPSIFKYKTVEALIEHFKSESSNTELLYEEEWSF